MAWALVFWLVASTAMAANVPAGVMPLDGRPAPALKLADADGNVTDLATLRGHWVLVHFWATWCGPCRKELPALEKMVPTLPPGNPAFVMVNTAETDDEVFAFLGTVAPSLVTLMDRDGTVTDRWRPRGLPATFFVDPQGRLRYLALGGRPWDQPEYRDFILGLGPQEK